MMSLFLTWLSLLFGKLGLGLALSLGCLAAWYFIPEVPWLTAKFRKVLLVVGIGAGLFTLGMTVGAAQAISTYQDKLTREINKSIAKGEKARADALKKFDANKEIENDGFARD